MNREQEINMYKECILANCKRVIYLLENEDITEQGNWSLNGELKQKMAEIRRDTVALGKKN